MVLLLSTTEYSLVRLDLKHNSYSMEAIVLYRPTEKQLGKHLGPWINVNWKKAHKIRTKLHICLRLSWSRILMYVVYVYILLFVFALGLAFIFYVCHVLVFAFGTVCLFYLLFRWYLFKARQFSNMCTTTANTILQLQSLWAREY